MLKLRVVCVGRRARDPLLDAADRYVERLSRFAHASIERVREGTMESERDAISARLKGRERIIALDEHGKQSTSQQLARQLTEWERGGVKEIVYLIGGADGLHPELKKNAAQVMALSQMTLPHRLAQVVLVEQLYRAFTIVRRLPYHRD